MERIRRLLIPTERPNFVSAPLVFAGIFMLVTAAGLMAWQTKPQEATSDQAQQISPYTKWLTEDVIYIITEEERAAFQRLQTDAERNQFIVQFWMRRNPKPGAAENPFMKEHYRRIQYANLHFPTGQGNAGWKTDRGRIYIVFGPPDEKEDHPNGNAAKRYPYEDWRYQFIEGIGNDVWMEFVDTTRSGDYRMTSDPNGSSGGRRVTLPNPR